MNPKVTYKELDSYPGYTVGSDGSVWSNRDTAGNRRDIRDWRKLETTHLRKGYPVVSLYVDGRSFTRNVHKLVLLAFVGLGPDGMEIRHLNGIKTDNRLENLVYGTHEENERDQIIHGTHVKGEKHGMAILKAEQVREIRRRRKQGEGLKSLSQEFGVSMSAISSIANYHSWKSVA